MKKLDHRVILQRYGLVVALIAISAGIAVLNPQFLNLNNLLNVLRQVSTIGILAVGVTFVLLTGGVDLSLGSVVALAGVVAAGFAHPDTYPVMVPVMMGVLAGLSCGVVNGLLVTKGRVAPFIVTLGMMVAARGLALVVSGGRPVSNLSGSFTGIASGAVGGIPNLTIILGFVALIASLFLRKFVAGRHIYAVGANEKAAFLCGLPVHRIKVLAYGISGAAAGLGGVVLASRITTGQPNAGMGYELDAIAAVVIGGTSLAGGVGGIGGTILGTLLIGVIGNGLDLLNVSSYYQQIVKGVIIVGAVWLDRRSADPC